MFSSNKRAFTSNIFIVWKAAIGCMRSFDNLGDTLDLPSVDCQRDVEPDLRWFERAAGIFCRCAKSRRTKSENRIAIRRDTDLSCLKGE